MTEPAAAPAAPTEGGAPAAEPAPANPQVIQGEAAAAAIKGEPAPADQRWMYSSELGAEVYGSGEKPEYLQEKYGSVEEQAKAYPELAQKMGSFTGAPDVYDVAKFADTGVFKSDAESFQGVNALMKDMGINQEGYDKLMDWYIKDRAEVEGAYAYDQDYEKEQLGTDAEHRINRADTFMRSHLDADGYDEVKDLLHSADSVKLVEALIGATAPVKLPKDGGPNPGGMDKEKLKEMRYARTENGDLRMSVDPEYRKQVEAHWENYFGKKPSVNVLG